MAFEQARLRCLEDGPIPPRLSRLRRDEFEHQGGRRRAYRLLAEVEAVREDEGLVGLSAADQGVFGPGFDAAGYAATVVAHAGGKARFDGAALSEAHERMADALSEPWSKRLYQLAMSEAGGEAAWPVPLVRLSETYAANASSRRQPEYAVGLTTDLSRPRPIADLLGVRDIVTRDDLTIPRFDAGGGIVAVEAAETAAVADAGGTVSVLTTNPKRIAVRNDVSTSLLVGAAPAQAQILYDLQAAAESRREQSFWTGSASGGATGLANVSGIHSVSVDGSTIGFDELGAMAEAIQSSNVDAPVVFATSPRGARAIRNTLRANDGAYRVRMVEGVRREFLFDGLCELACSRFIPDTLGAGSDETLILAFAPAFALRIMYAMGFLTIDRTSLAAQGQVRFTLNLYHDVALFDAGAAASAQWAQA